MQRNFTLCFHNIPFWFIEHWTVLNCKKIDEIACMIFLLQSLLLTEIHRVEIAEFDSLFILICNYINCLLVYQLAMIATKRHNTCLLDASSWIKKACFLFDEKKWELASSFCHFFQIITTVKRNTSSGNFLEALIMACVQWFLWLWFDGLSAFHYRKKLF